MEPRAQHEVVEDEHGQAETVVTLRFGRVVEDPAEVVGMVLALGDALGHDLMCPGHPPENRAARRARGRGRR